VEPRSASVQAVVVSMLPPWGRECQVSGIVSTVAFPKRIRLSHGGAKNSSSKEGWWGFRNEAKRYAKKAARLGKRQSIRDELDHQ
jgi:hypothetical protein